jgi:hypothetical protein
MHAGIYYLTIKSVHALDPHVASLFESITNRCMHAACFAGSSTTHGSLTKCSAAGLLLMLHGRDERSYGRAKKEEKGKDLQNAG